MKIETKDAKGQVNGFLVPIWNVVDGPEISQVYLTVISPNMMKGPHLHMKRRGYFKVLKGAVLLVWRWPEGVYHQLMLGINSDPCIVSAGVPAALYNVGMGEAYVLNMPHPAWSKDDEDEWPVENWDPPGVHK